MQELSLESILSLFRNEFDKSDNTGARILDSIYHMTLQLNKIFFILVSLKLQDMYKMNSNALAFIKVTSDWIKSLASLITSHFDGWHAVLCGLQRFNLSRLQSRLQLESCKSHKAARVSLAGWWWSNIECLVALWFYKEFRPVLLRNPISMWFFRGRGMTTCSPLWIRAWSVLRRWLCCCLFIVCCCYHCGYGFWVWSLFLL